MYASENIGLGIVVCRRALSEKILMSILRGEMEYLFLRPKPIAGHKLQAPRLVATSPTRLITGVGYGL